MGLMKQKIESRNLQLRIPCGTFQKLERIKDTRPHLNMNALICELIEERFEIGDVGRRLALVVGNLKKEGDQE